MGSQKKRTKAVLVVGAALALAAAGSFAYAALLVQEPTASAGDVRLVDSGAYQADLQGCLTRGDGQDAAGCVDLVVDTAISQGAIGAALGVIREASAMDQRYVPLCHDASHRVGQAAVQAGVTLGEAYSVDFPDCRFGFYHGALSENTKSLSFAELLEDLPGMCNFFGDGGQAKAQECTHATGHLLHDRSDNDIEKALTGCRKHTDGALAARCIDGVLMQEMEVMRAMSVEERAAQWGSARHEQAALLLKLCSNLDGQASYVCWNNVPQLLGTLWGADYPAIARACGQVDQLGRQACYEGIAASAFVNYGWDTRAITRACYSDAEAAADCLRSMAFTVGLQSTAETMSSLCNSVREAEREYCEEGLERGQETRAELAKR